MRPVAPLPAPLPAPLGEQLAAQDVGDYLDCFAFLVE